MSNSLNTSSVVSVKESADSLPRFPVQREREEFRDWLFKAEAFMAAKDMTDVVFKQVTGIRRYRSNSDINGSDNDDENVNNDLDGLTSQQVKHRTASILKSKKAYNYLIQSLNIKQIELVRQIESGNAYLVMSTLIKTYGMLKTTS